MWLIGHAFNPKIYQKYILMKKKNVDIKLETLRYHTVILFFFLGGGGGGRISLQSIFYCKSGPFVIQNCYTSFPKIGLIVLLFVE